MSSSTSSSPPTLQDVDQALLSQFTSALSLAPPSSLSSPSPTTFLLTTSQPSTFALGTGSPLISTLAPTISSAKSEVLFITCFWASSTSQRDLANVLRELAKDAQAEGRLVRVRLCFSSCGVWQKVSHTASTRGRLWGPGTWVKGFGLPAQEELVSRAGAEDGAGDGRGGGEGAVSGVELVVKSVFVRPFSVMHPKFVVVDREIVWLPSCNVSWEDWFEGAVRLTGGIVGRFVEFYERFWQDGNEGPKSLLPSENGMVMEKVSDVVPSTDLICFKTLDLKGIPTLFLPSEHHANPRFRPFWFQKPPPPPRTALNTFLLTSFDAAKAFVYLQTPNLTSPPVLAAILSALERGVSIRIVTSTKMMLLEQLATAGTITELCVKALIKSYQNLLRKHQVRAQKPGAVEAGHYVKPGRLSIRYYHPRSRASTDEQGGNEPVKSHLKLSIFDQRIVVLGSGNLDRASWYTSQELGVAFFSTEMARTVLATVEEALEGRLGREMVEV